jgi:hypothetical protein
MDNNKYFELALQHYKELASKKNYKIIKKIYYSTPLKGPHMDFFHLPYSLHP